MINWPNVLPRHQLCGQRNANELAARQWNMKIHLEGYAGWVSAAFQTMGLSFDPELLLWPGGSMIATVLWLYAMARTIALRFGIRLGAKSRRARSTMLGTRNGRLPGKALNPYCRCR